LVRSPDQTFWSLCPRCCPGRLGEREASIAIGELVIDVAGALVVVIVTVAAGADAAPFSQVESAPPYCAPVAGVTSFAG